jgi:hypothetical protein
VSTDGAGQIVSGTVTDTHGLTTSTSETINLDKTIPVLTVTSPADGTAESTSPVPVSGTLTDALSGVSGVTCDGVTATLSGGSFSCNISLAVGVNLVVVRGTDLAGNVAGDNFHVSLTGSLPAPTSLQVTPTGVNMVVGGTQQFTAVDDQGRPRSDATWSIDNTSIATIDTNSSPTLTAVATGTATLTATVGSVTAQTEVNVLSGTSLPPGAVMWSSPSASGYSNGGFSQAQPLDDSGPDVFVFQRGPSGQTLTGAYTNDGRQIWQTLTNDILQQIVPSQDGGQLAAFYNSSSGYYLTKTDGATGKQVWQFPLITNPSGIQQWAVGADGMLYLLEPQVLPDSTIYYPNLLGLDGATGAPRLRISLPNSTDQLIHSGCSDGQTEYNNSGPTRLFGPPEIAEDGTLRIEFTVENILTTISHVSDPNGLCDHRSVQYSSQLQVWNVHSNGTYGSTILTTLSGTVDCLSTNNYASCPYHSAIPGEVIPDGSGGSLASWKDEERLSYPYVPPPDVFHVSDVSSNNGTSDFTLPSIHPAFGYNSWAPMVLGENNTAFVSDGKNIAAFSAGSTVWTYAAASGNTPNLIVSATGGGLVAKTTASGVDTVLRFDPSGALTTDGWTGSNLDYYIGNLWFGSPSSGSGPALIAYSAGSVDLAKAPWLALAMMGSRKAIQYLHVTGPSNQGPNQAAILNVLQKILNALPSNSSCNNWLQGAGNSTGISGSALIQAQINDNTFGHGSFNIPGEAVSGGTNLDGSSIGVPSTFSFTVNDSGAFFNQTDFAGREFKYGPNGYPGNTLRAQAAILLHEYGHQLTIGKGTPTAFLSDFGIPKANEFNNKLVNTNCRQLIEGLQ